MQAANHTDAVLQARIEDAAAAAERQNTPHFVGFLDERQASLAKRFAETCGANFLLWGGHPDAERVYFGAFPFWQEPDPDAFPLCGATAVWRKCDVLSHRDFLGAFLAAGINRETLGDFLLEEGRCVFYCRREVRDFLFAQVAKIGRVGVKLSPSVEEPLPALHHFAPIEAVIASPRLDCVVAACTGLGRDKAAALIDADAVQVNHSPVHAHAYTVPEGALLSIRGKGRFLIDSVSAQTKKGKRKLVGRKFI